MMLALATGIMAASRSLRTATIHRRAATFFLAGEWDEGCANSAFYFFCPP